MAVNIELKRSAVPGKVPSTGSLNLGEIAINTYDGKVYFKKDDGTESIVELATTSGSATSASYALSASFASTASYALNVPATSSYALQALSASYALTASVALNVPATSSYALQALSASYATTASSADDFLVRGTLTAQTIVVQTITSSTEFVTGSTKFGSELSNTHQFTGSVSITGSLTSANATLSGSFSGSFQGNLTGTASFANNAASASYALTASYADNVPATASYALQALSSSYALTASVALNVPATASYALSALSASYALTASYADNAELLDGLDSSVFTQTGSFNSFTSSYFNASASLSTRVSDLEQFSSSLDSTFATDAQLNAATASLSSSVAALSSSFLSTSSSLDNRVSSLEAFSSSLDTTFTTDAQLNAATASLSSSIAALSSSFLAFSGSYNTGSFTGSFTGILTGTASFADNSTSASYALNTTTASYALTASVALNVPATSSYALSALSASYALSASNALTASYVLNAVSASYWSGSIINALSSSFATTASFSTSASFAQTASYVLNAVSASFASTASSVNQLNQAVVISGSLTVSGSTNFVGSTGTTLFSANADTLTFTGSIFTSGSIVSTGSLNITSITSSLFGTASFANNATSASFATTASFVQNAQTASYVLNAISSSFAATASSADNLTVRGTLTAQTIVVQTITSSTEIVTGSTKFGSIISNTHQFTGSVTVSGSLAVNGSNVILTNQTSSMSVATASYALTSSNVQGGLATYVPLWDTNTNLTSSYLNQSGNVLKTTYGVDKGLTLDFNFDSYILGNSGTGNNTYLQVFDGGGVLNIYSPSYTYFNDKVGIRILPTNPGLAVSGALEVTGPGISKFTNSTVEITGSLNISGSTTQIGNNNLFGNTTLSGSIIISGSATTPTVQVYGNVTHDGYIRFNPVSTNIDQSISASYIYVSGSTNDLYFTQNGNGYNNTTRLRWLEGNLYTGLLNGGLITIVTGSTWFNLSSGSGIIVDLNASLNDNPYPTVQYVNWGNFISQSLTFLTSSIQSYIGIDENGQIVQQTTPYVNGEFNTKILIGTVLHQNQTTVNASITYPNVAYGYKQRTYDFIKAFGPLKLSGYTINPSSSLGLTVAGGTAWADGRNYQTDPNNPSYIIDPGTSVSKIFRYYQSGSVFVQDTNGGLGYTVLDPANYNNNGTLTAVSPATPYTIQRVFWYPNSATKGIVVYYGNAQYTSIATAEANLNYETFNEVENTKQNAIYLGAVIIKYNGAFTNPNDYVILPGGIFRSVGGTGGGGSVVTTRLVDLSDVNISGPTDGQALVYNSTSLKWENESFISASISGNAASSTTASYAQTSSFLLGFTPYQITTGSITASVDVNPDNLFLIKSGSTQYFNISSSGDTTINSNLFIIKNFTTQQPVLTVSQSIVQFATQSSSPTGIAPNGGFWFTSTDFYVGID